MSTLTKEYTGTLTIVTCPNGNCATTYGIPESLYIARRRDHSTIYCPFGHTWHYPGESDLEKANRLAAARLADARYAEAAASAARDQLHATERSLSAQKGVTTKLRKRIAAGACPCCHRTFQNVARHMAGQHPDFPQTTNENGLSA